MVRVLIDMEGGVVTELKFTGDFFMHPEEAIGDLESLLRGVKITETDLQKLIEDFLRRNRVKVLGVTSKDFAAAIERAAEKLT